MGAELFLLTLLHLAKEYHPLVKPSPALGVAFGNDKAPAQLLPPSFRDSQKGLRGMTKSLLKARGDWIDLTRDDGEVLGAVSSFSLAGSPSVADLDSSGRAFLARTEQYEPRVRLAGPSRLFGHCPAAHSRLFHDSKSARADPTGRCHW